MRGQDVELRGIAMRFGGFVAVQPMELVVPAGQFFSILGPSGCGKTTLLRLVAGFLDPTEGEVRIGGASMAGIGPNRRPTALIFQNLALFPLMPVWENVAFGLEARGVPKAQRRKRADELLSLVALDGQGEKLPGALSGGQRQRVAIARALAVEPAVLLLDEPLSALDLKLRQHMRAELKTLQRKTGITFVYITHDQGEALAMSDRVAVMNRGRLEQVGTPDEIYDAPASAFVASFVGEHNRLKGRVAAREGGFAVVETSAGPVRGRDPGGLAVGAPAIAFVRPERMGFGAAKAPGNALSARLERRDLEGAFVHLLFRARDGEPILLALSKATPVTVPLDGEVSLGFAAADTLVLPDGELARE